MAIKQETKIVGSKTFLRVYSDNGVLIKNIADGSTAYEFNILNTLSSEVIPSGNASDYYSESTVESELELTKIQSGEKIVANKSEVKLPTAITVDGFTTVDNWIYSKTSETKSDTSEIHKSSWSSYAPVVFRPRFFGLTNTNSVISAITLRTGALPAESDRSFDISVVYRLGDNDILSAVSTNKCNITEANQDITFYFDTNIVLDNDTQYRIYNYKNIEFTTTDTHNDDCYSWYSNSITDCKTPFISASFKFDYSTYCKNNSYNTEVSSIVKRYLNEYQPGTDETKVSAIVSSYADEHIEYVSNEEYKIKLAEMPESGKTVYIISSDEFDMQNSRIQNLANPVNAQDAVTLDYLSSNYSTSPDLSTVVEHKYETTQSEATNKNEWFIEFLPSYLGIPSNGVIKSVILSINYDGQSASGKGTTKLGLDLRRWVKDGEEYTLAHSDEYDVDSTKAYTFSFTDSEYNLSSNVKYRLVPTVDGVTSNKTFNIYCDTTSIDADSDLRMLCGDSTNHQPVLSVIYNADSASVLKTQVVSKFDQIIKKTSGITDITALITALQDIRNITFTSNK